MDAFVCVRIIQANSLDLRVFQFDYDQSFAILFLRADGTIYGRYGTRSAKPEHADRDITMAGLRKALEAVLKLHESQAGDPLPEIDRGLAAKTGPAPRFSIPEAYPSLKEYRSTLNYEAEGQLARSCIHCHQIGDA
ncbi:MAG TPA: thioredoxin family protein, partial [Rhodothermales bacterium]|nr:thioredoxin family protein [Rhodothermales bacterium]